jgi:DNA-binding NtrC family response regulator
MKILVIEDSDGLRRSLTLILRNAGYEVRAAENGEQGLRMAEAEEPDIILTDVRMPVMDGIAFLDRYREGGGQAAVVVMTAYGGIDLAVEAVQHGAADYLAKPFGADEVHLVLRKVEEREALRREVGRLRDEVDAARAVGGMVAESPGMARVVAMARKVARHPSSILIQGETGTGKEVLARLIHQESDRRDAPFIAVNCGAVPGTLLESEFFGHVRGAFSGADRDRVGLFETAHLGTLFLDEVGEIPEPMQVKLLRVLQEGEVRRVGESMPRPVNARILAATNRDLREEVEAGRFREDLYYRLAVVTLDVPPLRDRPEDLPRLVQELLNRHAGRMHLPVPRVTPRAMRWIQTQEWLGNVRELENALERALVLAEGGQLDASDLTGEETEADLEAGPGGELSPVFLPAATSDLSVKRWGAALERELIRRALEKTGGHRGQAAELLELSARALRYKIREYGLDPDEAEAQG